VISWWYGLIVPNRAFDVDFWDILMCDVTVSPSPQSKDEENEKLHKLREYARDFRRQHTTDAEQFDWDSDDGDYGLAIGRLVVT
jgi:prolyl-tRNA synthetase